MQPEELWDLKVGQRVASPGGTVWRVVVVIKYHRVCLNRIAKPKKFPSPICLWTSIDAETCGGWSIYGTWEQADARLTEVMAFFAQKTLDNADRV